VYTGPVIDTHMHLWDLANGYPWLSKPDPAFERLIGNYDQLRRDFLAPDYRALTRDANVVKSVHIQAFNASCASLSSILPGLSASAQTFNSSRKYR